MTAHDTHTKKNILLDVDSAADLPIAYAARASMAHPLVASGVEISGYKMPGAGHVLSDGGISNNLPVEAIFGGTRPNTCPAPAVAATSTGLVSPEDQRLRAATAAITFNEGGAAYRILHGIPEESHSRWIGGRIWDAITQAISDAFQRWISNNPDLQANQAADNEKLYEMGVNALIVYHGDLDTLALDASEQRKEVAVAEARFHMLEQIALRQGQAYAMEVASVADAFAQLSETARRQVLANPPPPLPSDMPDDRAGRIAFRNLAAQHELYAMAVKARQQEDEPMLLFAA